MRNDIKRLDWFGTVTVENIEAVSELFRRLLDGKTYTWVGIIDGYSIQSRTEVRTDQKVDHQGSTDGNAFGLHYGQYDKNEVDGIEADASNADYAHFNVGDTNGIWGFSTSRREEEHGKAWDPEFNAPYVVFKWNKAKIIHRAPAGHTLEWHVAVQDKN